MTLAHKLLVQDSGLTEHYTDPRILIAARNVLGVIDLDPASNEIANKNVQARHIFTKEDNGLGRDWFGKVWMNHPFSKGEDPCPKDHSKCKKKICTDKNYSKYRGYHIDERIPSNLDWIRHLEHQFDKGNVIEAINIAFAEMSTEWGRIMTSGVICIPHGRTNYYTPEGKKQRGVTKGSMLRYWGNEPEKFAHYFKEIGQILVPADFK